MECILDNISVKWSENMSIDEQNYKKNGFTKTKCSVFIEPPSDIILKNEFNKIERGSSLSIGCKSIESHSQRTYSKIKDKLPIMIGDDKNKNEIAKKFIDNFFEEEVIWKNIHKNDSENIILEIRTVNTGCRWYLCENKNVKFRGLIESYFDYKTSFMK